MKFTLPFSKLFSILLILWFIVGFHSIGEAQITIQNNTNCNLFIASSQGNMTTVNPCDGCTLVGLNFVPMGGTLVLQPNLGCGVQFWQEVYWTDSFGSFGGGSRNPGLTGACGPDITGPCGGTNANWILSTVTGVGPAFVSIQ